MLLLRGSGGMAMNASVSVMLNASSALRRSEPTAPAAAVPNSTSCRSSLCRCRQDQHRRYGETHQGASAAASRPRTSCKAARKEESGGTSSCCWGAATARSAAGGSTGPAAALPQAAAAAGAGDGGCHAGISGAKLRCFGGWRGCPAVSRVGGWRQRAALLQQAQIPARPAALGAAGEHCLPVLGYAGLCCAAMAGRRCVPAIQVRFGHTFSCKFRASALRMLPSI